MASSGGRPAGRRAPEAAAVRRAVEAIAEWLYDEAAPAPDRSVLAEAVRLTARALAASAPGASVELRVPPFVAVQCISGPRHTRGTPPNVMETDARTWLLLSVGLLDIAAAVGGGLVNLSGSRAMEIGSGLPVVRFPGRRVATGG